MKIDGDISLTKAVRKRFTMPVQSIKQLVCVLILTFSFSLLADTNSEGWSWGVGCPGDGTVFTGSGVFTASTASGFSGSGSVLARRPTLRNLISLAIPAAPLIARLFMACIPATGSSFLQCSIPKLRPFIASTPLAPRRMDQ